MWTLAPIRRPTCGLSIGSKRISLVEKRRRWGWKRDHIKTEERVLPAGLLCPSSDKSNFMDQTAFVKELAALVGPSRCKTVALSIPVQSASLALLEFDSLPHNAEERRQLILWRLRRDHPEVSGDLQLAYRVWMRPSSVLSSEAVRPTPLYVLAAALSTATFREYREVCERAGCIPLSCGLDSLQLCDLYGDTSGASHEQFFVHSSGQHFFFLALREGCPVFLRVKSRRVPSTDPFTEVMGTLQRYDDYYPHAGLAPGARASLLHWFSDPLPGPVNMTVNGVQELGKTMVISTGSAAWRVEIRNRTEHPLVSEEPMKMSLAVLSALASVV